MRYGKFLTRSPQNIIDKIVAITHTNVSLKRKCEWVQQLFLINNVDLHIFACEKQKSNNYSLTIKPNHL